MVFMNGEWGGVRRGEGWAVGVPMLMDGEGMSTDHTNGFYDWNW